MLVKLKKAVNGLNIDTEFLVIAILIKQSNSPEIWYHVLNEDHKLLMVESSNIEITNHKLDSDLVFKYLGDNCYNILPESISYTGFFEDFFNDDENAINIFVNRFPRNP